MIVETEGLSKTFTVRRSEVEAVRGVDLRVEAGEIFGFLGPNGAGKTTTLRMLTTLLAPSGGRATVAGHDLLRQPRRVRERVGYVSQAGGVDDYASGRENLLLQARLCGLDAARAATRAGQLIDRLELAPFADRVARGYSGGQKRRLSLALGMIHEPALLFLDEPTVGLDPQSRARLWHEVRGLRDAGTTIFLTTHYLEEADALCDRLAIIDGGRIVAEGTPDQLKRGIAGDVLTVGLTRADAVPRAAAALRWQTFVRGVQEDGDTLRIYVQQGGQVLFDVVRLLDTAGITVETVTLAHPTLDDVFLQQTGRSLRDSDVA